ncbi:hypothetical protein XELAEV_18026605mg [Xenopus laevis]|uniref:Uncharacterized protein n=1 Tax=Xenopus laevis TaxID=8355 RepID=A0A974CU11_XENLA|nr:hypothetical protein XELAEV_18026605mg [Xenopus laevis]
MNKDQLKTCLELSIQSCRINAATSSDIAISYLISVACTSTHFLYIHKHVAILIKKNNKHLYQSKNSFFVYQNCFQGTCKSKGIYHSFAFISSNSSYDHSILSYCQIHIQADATCDFFSTTEKHGYGPVPPAVVFSVQTHPVGTVTEPATRSIYIFLVGGENITGQIYYGSN